MNQLTPKQQAFCDFYIETGNATQSYIDAGYKADKRSVAEANARKLLGNYSVREYIDKRIAEKDSERIAKQDEVLEYLTKVMRREEKEYTVVTLKRRKTYIDENGKRCTEESEVAEVVEIPSRLSDSNKAAELLGKRYVLWKENVDVAGDLSIRVALPVDE